MVKRTVELFECDVCGKDATRYQVVFEDGTKILDRCETHGRKLEKLREEPGDWLVPKSQKSTFHKSSLIELRAAVARAGNGNRPESTA